MTDAARLALIYETAAVLYANTATFDGELGTALAYLYPAVAQGTTVEWVDRPDGDGKVLALFRELFPPGHPIWAFITVTNG